MYAAFSLCLYHFTTIKYTCILWPNVFIIQEKSEIRHRKCMLTLVFFGKIC